LNRFVVAGSVINFGQNFNYGSLTRFNNTHIICIKYK
jgi:hypothetical protein